jgi:hypothetical protein
MSVPEKIPNSSLPLSDDERYHASQHAPPGGRDMRGPRPRPLQESVTLTIRKSTAPTEHTSEPGHGTGDSLVGVVEQGAGTPHETSVPAPAPPPTASMVPAVERPAAVLTEAAAGSHQSPDDGFSF